jgi:hypothetical protein
MTTMKPLKILALIVLAVAVLNTPSDVENLRDNPDVTQTMAGER